MKKVIMSAMFVMLFASSGFACGPGSMPEKIADGQWFIDEITIQLMGGDITQPIAWAGDMNSWGRTPAEVVSSPKKGVVVRGVGPAHFRWNLHQEALIKNNGWLYIERAFHNFAVCPNVYTPGAKAPNGYDWEGKGPSFWGIQ